MKIKFCLLSVVAVLGLFASGCEKKVNRIQGPAPTGVLRPPSGAVIPSPLLTVSFGGTSRELWPFTGSDFSGAPRDPVNLIFVGQSDPRIIRAALLSLNGDRTAFGFPNVFPFNCTWTDAVGDVQTGYATASGWVGSAIQLACGTYGPLRFHLRLFNVGDWTLGGAHFEVLIPGTTEHQVLSWELAEQLVVVDFLRSGLLDPTLPLLPTGVINPSPYREIPAVIYNGLPADLKALIGGPPGNVSDPVPLTTDGKATILNIAQSVNGLPVVAKQDFVVQFDQVIPKPFCASGPFDFVLVQGPVNFSQKIVMTPAGNFLSRFLAQGHLDVTPVNPLTDPPTPLGETYRALVNQDNRGIITDNVTLVSSFQMQIEIPPTGPFRGRLVVKLKVGPGGSNQFSLSVNCLP